jgi:hypothetical protein
MRSVFASPASPQLPHGGRRVAGAARRRPDAECRGDRRAGGALRHRQVHVAASGRAAGKPGCRPGADRWPGHLRHGRRGAHRPLRGKSIGFVYQFHHLLPEFTALENVVLPQMAIGTARAAAETRAHELLASFGLTGREGHRPGRLSGGEQQRVAISRALANRPGCCWRMSRPATSMSARQIWCSGNCWLRCVTPGLRR